MWQEIDSGRHYCHWWQDLDRSSITAMSLLLIVLVLSLAAIAWSVRAIFHDGPSARPPRSHGVDTDFVAPTARGAYERAA
jgi:hypothetical protein